MKNVLKYYFPLLLTVLCVFFILQILFWNISEPSANMFTSIGERLGNIKQTDNTTMVAKKEGAKPQTPLPSITYSGGTLTSGTAVSFPKLFTLTYADGSTASPAASTTAAVYLSDIRNTEQTPVLTRLSSKEIQTLEELPSAVVYDTDRQLLYFYQNGIYSLSLQFFVDGEDGVYFACQIPVEVH